MKETGHRRPLYDRQLNRIVNRGGLFQRMFARSKRWDDLCLMTLAIDMARECKSESGKVSPKVGAVIARDGRLLGVAFRGELKPGEHAEYTLLERKLPEETLAGATLFTTLEPCTARNSPKIPCAERIVDRQITRVVIGVLDPNPAIRGSGELHLGDKHIQVDRFPHHLKSEIWELNREFRRLHSPS